MILLRIDKPTGECRVHAPDCIEVEKVKRNWFETGEAKGKSWLGEKIGWTGGWKALQTVDDAQDLARMLHE